MPAVAAIMAPPVVVLRRLPEPIFDTARFVVVALVVVELSPVKFWRVEEADERNPPVNVESPVTEREPSVPNEVSDEPVTPLPNVVPDNTEVLLIR